MYSHGYTDATFADAVKAELVSMGKATVGVSASSVHKWRTGANVPRPSKIAAILNVTDGEIGLSTIIHDLGSD